MRLRHSTLALLGLFSLALLSSVQAQVSAVPQMMNFQGRLARPDGTPVADGTYSIRFSLWDALSGGTERWSHTLPVAVHNGTFMALLGGSQGTLSGPLAPSLFFTPLWLQIKVGLDAPLTPRQPFVTVANAFKAEIARTVPDGSIGAAQLATDFASLTKVSGGVLSSNGTNVGLNDRLLGFRGVGDTNHGLGYFGSYGGSGLDGPALFGFGGGTLGYQNTRVLTWTNQGRVGIGTAAPGMKLDVAGTDTVGIRYLRTDARDARIQVGDPTKTWSLATGWAVAGDLSIIEEGTAGNRFYIQKTSGNVGIGTSTPASKLDVAGTVQMTGFKLSTGAGANKVLTSDASGVGTWNTLASLLGNNSITNAMIQSVDWNKITNVPVSSWSLTGNSGTNPASHFVGTTDNQPLVFKVNGHRALQMQHVLNGDDLGMNVLGGYWLNSISAGVTQATVFGGGIFDNLDRPNRVFDRGGTVSGGAGNRAGTDNAAESENYATVGGGFDNAASADSATVAGGNTNTASGHIATVGGGYLNTASGAFSTVGGGSGNTASGEDSMVPGGRSNIAAGEYAFAAGLRAEANHNGAFVWADSAGVRFRSTANNQFNVRASGGTRIFSDSGESTGVLLAAGGGSWSSASDRNLKTNFQNVDTLDVLEKLVSMPLTTWNYKANTDIRHIGVMAQDFFAAFGGLGMDDKHIDTVDSDGVAFAAIQGLNRKLEAKEKRLQEEVTGLKVENVELKARLEALEAAVQRLTAQPK